MSSKGSYSSRARSWSPTRRTSNTSEVPQALPQINELAIDSHSTPTEPQLFSSFVSLAYSLALQEPDEPVVVDLLDRLRHKDLGVLNAHLIAIGVGSSFLVSRAISQSDNGDDAAIPGLNTIVLKRTIPTTRTEDSHQLERIKSLMLELRVLAHGPVRRHENIVRLFGIAWETDHLDLHRRWPVLIMERATKGTLSDFLDPSAPKSLQVKMALALDVVLGLKLLHQCGILHGDVKAANVLVFENRDPETNARRPFIAKLGDFSGVLFDMKDSMQLPSGTRPWNAPQWRQRLKPDSLLTTDVYSLGFLIFVIMADGKHPFRDFSSSTSTDLPLEEVEGLKERNDELLDYMKSLSGLHEDVDMTALHSILDNTLRFDPEARSLDKVEMILRQTDNQQRASSDLDGPTRRQVQLRDQPLPFSFLGLSSLDCGIAEHLVAELARTSNNKFQPKNAPEAAYGLAVLSINGITGDTEWKTRKAEGLKWLEKAAQSGSNRAQASFARACWAFDADIPDACTDMIRPWLRDTASKGFFTAFEDLAELNFPEALEEARATLRGKYGGTGACRYDERSFLGDSPASLDQRLWNYARKVRKPEDWRVGLADGNILHFAASYGLKKTANKLIENFDQDALNAQNVRGETALLLACRSGHYFVTMMLLEAGADPLFASKHGDTPLHWSLSFDDRYVDEVVQKLKEKGAHIDAVAQKFSYIHCGENTFIAGTPLMRAVTRNKQAAVIKLLRWGADPNFTYNGTSAINMAAFLHYYEILDLLLRHSSDSPRTVERSTGMSLLMRVIMGGSLEANGSLFGRIRRHGRRWHLRAEESLQVLLNHGAREHLHNVPGLTGLTALFLAVTFAETDIVKLLLENGCAEHVNTFSAVPADPQTIRTPLAATIKSRNLETFYLLLQHGANVRQTHSLDESDSSQLVTLLYECSWVANDNPSFAQALIDRGVSVDESPTGYETPFGCALRNRCFALAECLLQNHADINKEYTSGLFFTRERPMTVLGHLLTECSVNTLACLNFLFQPRNLPESRRPGFLVAKREGFTVLHTIARHTPLEKPDDRALELILDRVLSYFKPSQEQLDATYSTQRYTALHIAVMCGNFVVVRGLVNGGAGHSLKDVDGYDVLELARRCSSFSAVMEVAGVIHEKSPEKLKRKRDDTVRLLEGFSLAERDLPIDQTT